MKKDAPPEASLKWGIISALMFTILGSLLCMVFFKNPDAKTYGGLVSVAIGTMIGPSEWWQNKKNGVHIWFTIILISLTAFLIICRESVINLFKNLTHE